MEHCAFMGYLAWQAEVSGAIQRKGASWEVKDRTQEPLNHLWSQAWDGANHYDFVLDWLIVTQAGQSVHSLRHFKGAP